MRRRKESSSEDIPSLRKPASTPDDREAQMIELADRLAERQLREGTASSQVITHYLKLGSSREKLEQTKLEYETKLVQAKTEAIANQARSEELFRQAIRAMKSYQGVPTSDDEDYEYED